MKNLVRQLAFLSLILVATACAPVVPKAALDKTGTFTHLASMSQARVDYASEAVNGKIYVMGGVVGSQTVLDSVEQYDPATDSWSPMAQMTSARQGMASAAYGNSIYLFGGNDFTLANQGGVAVTEAYDTVSNMWSTVASMPAFAEYASARTVGSKIYVFPGAQNSGGITAQAWIYDPTANSWTTGSTYPGNGTNGAEPVTVGTQIYFVGRDPMIIYDTSNDTWSQISGVMAGMSDNGGQAAAILNGSIYMFDEVSFWKSGLEVYSLTPSISSKMYFNPNLVTLCRTVVLNGSAYITGGAYINYGESANLYRFDAN